MKTLTLILSLQLAALATWAGQEQPTPQPTALVQTVVNDEGEKLIATGTGNTLYVFDRDLNQAQPVCNATCAEVWPPYLISDDETKALQSPLGSIKRTNGQSQLTYEGRPVYTYAFDRHAADDKGDGLGGVWHYIEVEAKLK